MKDKDSEHFYMEMAKTTSLLSKCEKKKVGAIAVKNDNILGFGYNGTPYKWYTNVCEDENFKTKDEVVHAEENIVAKAARDGISLKDSTMFITYEPCKRCCRLLYQAGVRSVIWFEDNGKGGKEMLNELGVFNKRYVSDYQR